MVDVPMVFPAFATAEGDSDSVKELSSPSFTLSFSSLLRLLSDLSFSSFSLQLQPL